MIYIHNTQILFFLHYIVLIFVFHTEVVSLIRSPFFRHEMTFTNYSDTVFTGFLFNELSVSIDKIIARNTKALLYPVRLRHLSLYLHVLV